MMKVFAVILLAMIGGALASSLSKREELDPVTRMQLREQRLRIWCTKCKIQFSYIELISQFIYVGDVYRDRDGNVHPDYGVIIGTGIDLGYITEDFLRNELGESEDVINKLIPYLGLKGDAAAAKLASDPLVLTESEAKRLSNLYLDYIVKKVEEIYNDAVKALGQLKKLFMQLPCKKRSAIITIYVRYHNQSPSWFDQFWNYLVEQLWNDAANLLSSLPDDIFLNQRSIEDYYLRIDGIIDCVCEGWAYFCHDPHVDTFDGRHFGYQGVCSYVLFTDGCGKRRGSFSVESTTEAAIVNGKDVSKVSALTVRKTDQSYSTTINLNKNDVTFVNGKRLTTFPYHVNADTVIDKTDGDLTRVRMFGKFTVTWNGDGRIQTSLDTELFGKVCGLLGDADGDKMNDFRMPNGTITKSLDEFGESWQVPGSNC